MTVAVSKAAERGAKVVICASTGNTSASAAAYAARAGLLCAVVLPAGQIALGKLAQALIHGARVVPVHGNFDEALAVVRELGERPGVEVVNSINPVRIEGQKTAAFEIVDVLGDGPTVHSIPVGNAGNITAYWQGYCEDARRAGRRPAAPRMLGWQAVGAAPIVHGEPVLHPETIATAIQIGNPASWARRGRGPGRVGRPHRRRIDRADPRRLPAPRGDGGRLRRAGVGGVGRRAAAGRGGGPRHVLRRRRVHASPATGLKDPKRAIAEVEVGDAVDPEPDRVAARSGSDADTAIRPRCPRSSSSSPRTRPSTADGVAYVGGEHRMTWRRVRRARRRDRRCAPRRRHPAGGPRRRVAAGRPRRPRLLPRRRAGRGGRRRHRATGRAARGRAPAGRHRGVAAARRRARRRRTCPPGCRRLLVSEARRAAPAAAAPTGGGGPSTADDLWLLNSTSGTTGLPKCVMHHQRRWFAFHELAVDAGGAQLVRRRLPQRAPRAVRVRAVDRPRHARPCSGCRASSCPASTPRRASRRSSASGSPSSPRCRRSSSCC